MAPVNERRPALPYRTTADLESQLDHVRAAPADAGAVRLVVRRPDLGVREILEEGRFDLADGLVGDTWLARARSRAIADGRHFDAQVNVMSARMVAPPRRHGRGAGVRRRPAVPRPRPLARQPADGVAAGVRGARRRRGRHRGQRQAAQRLRQVRRPLRRGRGALRQQRDGQAAAAAWLQRPGGRGRRRPARRRRPRACVGVVWMTRQIPVPGARSPSNVRGDTRHPPPEVTMRVRRHTAALIITSALFAAGVVAPADAKPGNGNANGHQQGPLPRVPRARRGRRRRERHHHRHHLPRQPGDRHHVRHLRAGRPRRGRRGVVHRQHRLHQRQGHPGRPRRRHARHGVRRVRLDLRQRHRARTATPTSPVGSRSRASRTSAASTFTETVHGKLCVPKKKQH